MKKDSNYLKQVREQYENYPYPPRDPEEEKTRIQSTLMDSIDQINYYCFEGKQTFDNGFRVLVAGGGTGDSLVYLADQLRDHDAEIVYLDISEASMEVAKERAKVRGLENITWTHDSLLELPKLDLGTFDFINCSGVLHHLDNPQEGLKALHSVLHDDGAMGIMVYGQYGRTGVYHMQDMMRILNQDEPDLQKQVDNCKKVLGSLPPTSWFKIGEERISDHKNYGDNGIYDLFLHTQDRAYTIPQLYEWVESCGLVINKMLAQVGSANQLYSPDYYIKDPQLVQKIEEQSEREQQAIAELLCGWLIKHTFYITTRERPYPQDCDDDYIPSFNIAFNSEAYDLLYENVKEAVENAQDEYITITIQRGKALTQNVKFKHTPNTIKFFEYIDGKRSFKEIFDCVLADAEQQGRQETYESIKEEFLSFYEYFVNFDWVFVRHKSVPAYKALNELQIPVHAKHVA